VSDEFNSRRGYDVLLSEIPTDATPREAAVLLRSMLRDAEQAHRAWAQERLDDALLAGLAREFTNYRKRQAPRVEVKGGGSVKRIGGVRRRDAAGKVRHQQVDYFDTPFAEIADHVAQEVATLAQMSRNSRALQRLLDLQDKVPTAATPQDACRILGLDPADVMAGAA